MKAQKKLIDDFRKTYFDPKEFGGYLHDDFRFSRVFNYNGKPVKERFEEINDFLREQGFDALDYDVFIKDLGVRNENVLIYANDARDEKDVILFLMIDIYNPWSN